MRNLFPELISLPRFFNNKSTDSASCKSEEMWQRIFERNLWSFVLYYVISSYITGLSRFVLYCLETANKYVLELFSLKHRLSCSNLYIATFSISVKLLLLYFCSFAPNYIKKKLVMYKQLRLSEFRLLAVARALSILEVRWPCVTFFELNLLLVTYKIVIWDVKATKVMRRRGFLR